MMERGEAANGEATTLRQMYPEKEKQGNTAGDKPAILVWPTRDIQKVLFIEWPKRNFQQAGSVELATENASTERAVPIQEQRRDFEKGISGGEEGASKEVELVSNPKTLLAARNDDESVRILKEAGWNVSQNLRKNGKVQWYYRSPDGCLAGSLSTAMDKWRQTNEGSNNNCSVDNKNPFAKSNRVSKPRPPMKSAKVIGIASPNDRTKESAQETDRMQHNIIRHDNVDMMLGAWTREAVHDTSTSERDPKGQGISIIENFISERSKSGLNSFAAAESTHISPVGHFISKRNAMETAQVVVDDILDLNELKRRKIDGFSSLTEQQHGCPGFKPVRRPIEGAGVVVSGVVSPVQLESNPEMAVAVKIAENTGMELTKQDAEKVNSVADNDASRKMLLLGSSKLPDVQDEDECRRILIQAGWKVSESLRKNGKVQWYYRSPNGCLLGSLLTAIGKWRQMNEGSNCSVDHENPMAKSEKGSKPKRRLQTKSSKGNIGIASPNDRAKESVEEPDRMEESITGGDSEDMVLVSGIAEGSHGSLTPVGNAEGIDYSTISTSKRKAVETDQLVVDEILDSNELKRRKTRGSSSSVHAAQERDSHFMSSGSPIEGVQNVTHESGPDVAIALKIGDDCGLGREVDYDCAWSDVGRKTYDTGAGIALQPNSPTSNAFTPPHLKSLSPATTNHSEDEVEEQKIKLRVLQSESSDPTLPQKIILPRGKSPEGSFPLYKSPFQETGHPGLGWTMEGVKNERRHEGAAVDVNSTLNSSQNTDEAGGKPTVYMELTRRDVEPEQVNSVEENNASQELQFLGSPNLPDVRDEVECRRILRQAGWKVSESLRKNGKVQWYYRSPNGCLLGSLLTAMGKWRQMNEESFNCSVDKSNTLANSGRVSKSGRRPPMKLPKGNIQIASPNKSAKKRGPKIHRMEQEAAEHHNGDMILASGTPEKAHNTVTPGRNAVCNSQRPSSRLKSRGSADGKGVSPVSISTSKRKAMEAYQLVVDEVLGLNELKRRNTQGSSSSSEQHRGYQGVMSGGGLIEEDLGVLGGVASPFQNSTLLESVPGSAIAVKIKENSRLARDDYNRTWDDVDTKRYDTGDRGVYDESRQILRDASWNVSQSLRFGCVLRCDP